MPLEVGGALRSRLEAEGRSRMWKGIGKDISHMPAASSGHNASLSFVVIGKSQD
jgi:hypothetical protein